MHVSMLPSGWIQKSCLSSSCPQTRPSVQQSSLHGLLKRARCKLTMPPNRRRSQQYGVDARFALSSLSGGALPRFWLQSGVAGSCADLYGQHTNTTMCVLDTNQTHIRRNRATSLLHLPRLLVQCLCGLHRNILHLRDHHPVKTTTFETNTLWRPPSPSRLPPLRDHYPVETTPPSGSLPLRDHHPVKTTNL